MIIFFVFTIIAIGKRSRVFSSFFQFLGSALKIQLQNYKKKDSFGVVIGFMQDHNYWTMNFVTLKHSA